MTCLLATVLFWQSLVTNQRAALQHLVEGIRIGGADAVLAASIFHYGEYTIAETKRMMQNRGVIVRL